VPEQPQAELVKLEIIEQPEIVIVGKFFHLGKDDMSPAAFWKQCGEEGVFATLEALSDHIHNPAHIGFMDTNNGLWRGGTSRYLCGMMMKPGVPVPDGFATQTLKPAKVGVGWIKGKKSNFNAILEVKHHFTEKAIVEKGLKLWGSHDWCMEVYTHRATTPDENGDIILDYYIPCE